MPIDPKSTEPGLATAAVAEKPVLNINCTHGCGSNKGYEVSPAVEGRMHRVYQCANCKCTWSVPVGSTFVL